MASDRKYFQDNAGEVEELMSHLLNLQHENSLNNRIEVANCYPAGILKAVSKYFNVPVSQIYKLVQVPASTARRLVNNSGKVSSAASTKLSRILSVTEMAIQTFENEEFGIRWMCQANLSLGNAPPLDLVVTKSGALAVRQVINAIRTGGVV